MVLDSMMNIQRMLLQIADMQRYFAPDDELTRMIEELSGGDDELDISDLEFVSAAKSTSYSQFMAKVQNQKRD